MSTYGSAPKPKSPGDPKRRMPKRRNTQDIDPFNEQNTEDAAGGRYNPWGKGSKMNPTKSSQTTGP